MPGPATFPPVKRPITYDLPIGQCENGQNPVIVQPIHPGPNSCRVHNIISEKQTIFPGDFLEELGEGTLIFFHHESDDHLSAIAKFFMLGVVFHHVISPHHP
jgi:hypothetical protein